MKPAEGTPKPRISLAQATDLPDWDAYIHAHPEGSPFLTSAWQSVASTYGHSPYCLLVRRGDSISGGLPLYCCSHLGTGKILVSAPFCSYGGTCVDAREDADLLVTEAIRLAGELGVRYLALRGLVEHNHPDLRSGSTSFVNPRVELFEPDQMWTESLKGRARTAVRKARKSGVRIERGHHLLNDFHDVMARSMRHLGTPVHSKAFYGAILSGFGANAEILVAFAEDLPVGGYLLIGDSRTTFHLSGGSRPGYQKLNANSLLMWESIVIAHHSGAARFDFGRSSAAAGTLKFKEQWGGESTELHYQYFLNGSTEVPNVDPSDPKYRLAIQAWTRMPLRLTKVLGPHIIRRIP